MRTVWAFICALVATYIVGTTGSAAPHLRWLESIGMPVTMDVQIDTYLQALVGMLPAYLPLAGTALLVAFSLTWLIVRRIPWLSALGYAIGGFCAMVALMAVLKAVFGMSPIPSTRDLGGLLVQGAAGAVGGFVFYLMKPSVAVEEAA